MSNLAMHIAPLEEGERLEDLSKGVPKEVVGGSRVITRAQMKNT